MTITRVYAVMSTAQLGRAYEWYARLFGRASDRQPMAEVQTRDMVLGPVAGGDFSPVAQIADPDGNRITFAEPRRSSPTG